MSSTLLAYRTALQRALDDVGLYIATSGSGTTVVSNFLINTATAASTGRYNGAYVYFQSGTGIGGQGVVKENGYAPSTGTLTFQATLNTAPGSGTVFEITRLFPSIRSDTSIYPQTEDTDYRSIINRALSMIVMPDQVSVTTVASQQEYSLSTYAYWLDRPERLLAVLDPPRASGWPTKPTWRRWELQLDGGVPTLQFIDRAYPVSSATFELSVMRPANTLISGTESTTGLSADTDTALPSVNDVVTIALMYAYESLANRSPGRPNGDYLKRYAAQVGLARRVRYYDKGQETAQQQAAAPEVAA